MHPFSVFASGLGQGVRSPEQYISELAKTDRDRVEFFRECAEAAKTSSSDPYTVPAGQPIAVITEPDVDLWAGSGSALLPSGVDFGSDQGSSDSS